MLTVDTHRIPRLAQPRIWVDSAIVRAVVHDIKPPLAAVNVHQHRPVSPAAVCCPAVFGPVVADDRRPGRQPGEEVSRAGLGDIARLQNKSNQRRSISTNMMIRTTRRSRTGPGLPTGTEKELNCAKKPTP